MCENPHVDMDRPAVAELMADVSAALAQRVLLAGFDVGTALAFGIAHGALVMTTPGDTSMATLAEVRRLAAGRSARVIR